MSSTRRGYDIAIFAGASVAAGTLALPTTSFGYATVGETITRTVAGYQFVQGPTIPFGGVSLTVFTSAIPTDDVFGHRAGAGSAPSAKLSIYSQSTGVTSTYQAAICRRSYLSSTSVCGSTLSGNFTAAGNKHLTISTAGTYATNNSVNDYYYTSVAKASAVDLLGIGHNFVACW